MKVHLKNWFENTRKDSYTVSSSPTLLWSKADEIGNKKLATAVNRKVLEGFFGAAFKVARMWLAFSTDSFLGEIYEVFGIVSQAIWAGNSSFQERQYFLFEL